MFGPRWRLFRLFGIPLYIDLSWLLILALITWTLGTQFRLALPEIPEWQAWGLGLGTALAFFACIVLHELGHAIAARSRGMPVRGITLFLFGGVMEMGTEPPSASSEFIMAVAGPLVTLVLAGTFGFLFFYGQQAGWAPQAMLVLLYLYLINLIVLIFNMVPAFPLDGGRILRSALWAWTGKLRQATRWAALLGQGFAWFLILLGAWTLFIPGIPLLQGFWLIIIGLFLNAAASGSYQQVVLREALRGETVSRFMTREPITVPPTLDLASWVDDYVYRHHRRAFPVASNGHVEGVISTEALQNFPREQWPQHTVAEVMQERVTGIQVSPETDALDALEKMQRTGSSRLLVTEGNRLIGIVSLKDLLRFLDLKLELEPSKE